MEIIMGEAEIKIGTRDDGIKAIVAECPRSGIRVIIPLTEESARAVATALASGIILPIMEIKQNMG